MAIGEDKGRGCVAIHLKELFFTFRIDRSIPEMQLLSGINRTKENKKNRRWEVFSKFFNRVNIYYHLNPGIRFSPSGVTLSGITIISGGSCFENFTDQYHCNHVCCDCCCTSRMFEYQPVGPRGRRGTGSHHRSRCPIRSIIRRIGFSSERSRFIQWPFL
jgi:hypothetical protein